MSPAIISRPFRTAASWLLAAAGVAFATAATAFPGSLAIPGVSPDHLAAILPVLLLPLVIHAWAVGIRRAATGTGRVSQFARGYATLSPATKTAAVLLLIGAVVHLALMPNHLVMEPQTGVLFGLDVAGFLVAAVLTLTIRRWRIPAGLMSLLTVVAYAYYIHNGLEDLDLTGILTSAAEIAVIPVALFDWVGQNWRFPGRRIAAVVAATAIALFSTTTVAHAAGTGALAKALSPILPSPDGASAMGMGSASMTSTSTQMGTGSMPGDGNMNGGSPFNGAMNPGSMPMNGGSMMNSVCPNVAAMPMSNGMLMQPVPSTPPTPDQVAAANQLVAQTTAGIAQYSDYNAALAAGYKPVTRTGGSVIHLVNRQNFSDNPLANPSAPQSLVFAHSGNNYTLLGAMYLTNGLCKEGPDIGGSLTDWHAHVNLCFNAGNTITGSHPNSSGQCPSGQKTHATPFMLHVYTVANNPQGPFELSNSTLQQILKG
jgi:hypothetical protein